MTTQFANASYQEIIDLHTESDTVSVIGIHTPIGDTPRKMFGGFFDQFKKYKYLGCSISLVPAARLPADPLAVSYEAGEPTIDPRDLLNPLMFHGAHGNDLGTILNRLYSLNSNGVAGGSDYYKSDSTDLYIHYDSNVYPQDLENLYYKALTDNTWKKAHPQKGFKKSGLSPRVYSLATTHQISNVGFNTGLSPNDSGMFGFDSSGDLDMLGLPTDPVRGTASGGQIPVTAGVSKDGIQFMTPRLVGLGWLDTRNVLTVQKSANAQVVSGGSHPTVLTTNNVSDALWDAVTQQEVDAELPLIYMGVILLPPAYKTEQYFRMIVNHHFAFAKFRGISFSNDIETTPCYDNWNESLSTGTGGNSSGGSSGSGDTPSLSGTSIVLSNKITTGVSFKSNSWDLYLTATQGANTCSGKTMSTGLCTGFLYKKQNNSGQGFIYAVTYMHDGEVYNYEEFKQAIAYNGSAASWDEDEVEGCCETYFNCSPSEWIISKDFAGSTTDVSVST